MGVWLPGAVVSLVVLGSPARSDSFTASGTAARLVEFGVVSGGPILGVRLLLPGTMIFKNLPWFCLSRVESLKYSRCM